jgi:hypothetical protein
MNVLANAAAELDHQGHAAEAAAGAAAEVRIAAEQRLAHALVPDPKVEDQVVARAPHPLAAPGAPDRIVTLPASDHVLAATAVRVAEALHVERLGLEVSEATAQAAAAHASLELQLGRRQDLHTAAQHAEQQIHQFDAQVQWLHSELGVALESMLPAGLELVEHLRVGGEAPIVEVRGFYVHEAIAGSVRQLVEGAALAGIDLQGIAHRPVERQIELRQQNCGPTPYDIYEKPAGLCAPPTAKPGRSLHEMGLALDFRNGPNGITSRRDPAFQWLARHAPSYGLHNLPAEPWHWSVTGQ